MFRIFLTILCLFLSFPAFADYKPISPQLSKQYKAEMERIIAKEYPTVIKKTDKDINEATVYYNRIMKYGYSSNNGMDASNLELIYEICLPAEDLELYSKLMRVTQEKYLGVPYEPFATDWIGPFQRFLDPYFKENKVNTKKLDELSDYMAERGKIVKQYLDQVEKMRPISD